MKYLNQKNIQVAYNYINQEDFYKLYSRNACVQIAENFAYYSILELKRIMKVNFSQLMVNNHEFIDVYSLEKDIISVNKTIRQRLKRSKTIKDFYEDKALPVYARYTQFTKKMQEKYLDKKTGQTDLLRDYTEFAKINASFIALNFYIFFTDLVIERLLKEYLTKYLEKINESKKLQEYLELISTPIKKPAVVREHKEFLILASEKQTLGDQEKLLKAHAEKWKWFPCYNPSDDPYQLDHYRKELKQYKPESAKQELNKIKLEQKKHQQKYEKFLESSLDSKLKRLIPITNMVCFYREYRNDLRREGLYCIKPLFEKIGKKFGLNVKEVCYLTNAEIKKSLISSKLQVTKRRIRQRIKKYILYGSIKQNILIDDEKNVDEIVRRIKEKEERTDIIKGQTASTGIARGKVVVISNINKLKNFKENSVLVASMTAPDYVPAMKKSAAIITDEGGITCHAAIISRELSRPCIIGTRIATKVLKDGDLVEVDADKGIVKIIK